MKKQRLRTATIVADDYGIGPETSRGILDLAKERIITATVMIVNAADAERATQEWQHTKPDVDLGWHPNLTLDRPIAPPHEVPSLVRADGTFWPLGAFLLRLLRRQIQYTEVVREWRAQLRRFIDLVGHPPMVVNSHQHVSLFPPCRAALFEVFTQAGIRPYLRRVVEREQTLAQVPGARIKRGFLTLFGRATTRQAVAEQLPGADWLIGVTDHPCVAHEWFWEHWLGCVGPSGTVEVCCHPGYRDDTLIGRDCDAGDGLQRRPRETALLRLPSFAKALAKAHLTPVRPSTWVR